MTCMLGISILGAICLLLVAVIVKQESKIRKLRR
jgi:hypothetical protein